MKKYYYSLFIIMILLSVESHALDTTHTHPLVTKVIGDLIRNTDTNDEYEELYETIPDTNPPIRKYWGTDFDPAGIVKAQDEGTPLYEYFQQEEEQTKQYLDGNNPKEMNVITGVVYEDNPATKVMDHFYHGVEGAPLTVLGFSPGEPSAVHAMNFYNQSIEKMGHYGEASKQEAFFLFGQALHHVEDMTSPAHIHNDAHLTLNILGLNFDAGKDDYEGWWLPQQKIDGSEIDVDAILASATTITSVTNPWQDIWSTSGTSLVQQIFNGSTFDASLNYTFSTFTEVANSYDYFPKAGSVLDPVGEMAEMFPCPPPLNNETPGCLHWSEDAPDAPAHWEINGVGGFQHQFFVGADDAWWPIEADVNTSIIGQKPAPFYKDKYYIEELASDNKFSDPVGNVLVPAKMRSSLYAPWPGNMQVNTVSILEKYANTFLTTAVNYGAGFTQNWYDIANTPPYLKTVTAEQLPAGGGTKKTTYKAEWTFGNNSTIDDVEERVMARQIGDISHMHSKQDLTLELEFNEPIKQITLLRIGEFNLGGFCVSPDNGCVDITPPAPIDGIAPLNVEFDAEKGDKIWRITVPKSQLNNLNGKLQLTVKAQDKNRHFDGFGFSEGAELDATPETPARRNITFANDTRESGNPEFRYPWYQKGILDETPEDVAYSYDFAEGDQNHVLVFDVKKPTATITIDLTL